jgi:hypothetical protein
MPRISSTPQALDSVQRNIGSQETENEIRPVAFSVDTQISHQILKNSVPSRSVTNFMKIKHKTIKET